MMRLSGIRLIRGKCVAFCYSWLGFLDWGLTLIFGCVIIEESDFVF